MFENKQINGYTYATRYIASWLKEGGQLHYRNDIDNFYNWLLSMELSEEDANHIRFLATNGKMELEYRAKMYLKNQTN